MNWKTEYIPEALNDLKELDGSVRPQVIKGIRKVSQNPLPDYKGGYGKPLGARSDTDLTGLLKIKFKKIGIRVVYKLEETDDAMKIIIISARADNRVYEQAEHRKNKYGL